MKRGAPFFYIRRWEYRTNVECSSACVTFCLALALAPFHPLTSAISLPHHWPWKQRLSIRAGGGCRVANWNILTLTDPSGQWQATRALPLPALPHRQKKSDFLDSLHGRFSIDIHVTKFYQAIILQNEKTFRAFVRSKGNTFRSKTHELTVTLWNFNYQKLSKCPHRLPAYNGL